MGTYGNMNCPQGYVLVTDELECQRNAAPFLNKRWIAWSCYATERRGCFASSWTPGGDLQPHISFSTCNHKPHHFSLAGVCKGEYLALHTQSFSIFIKYKI